MKDTIWAVVLYDDGEHISRPGFLGLPSYEWAMDSMALWPRWKWALVLLGRWIQWRFEPSYIHNEEAK